jgi:hypothetical protein
MAANNPRQARPGGRGAQNAPGDGGPLEAAAFIAETVIELTELAHRHRLGTLAYLLDMARMEAEEYVRASRASPSH